MSYQHIVVYCGSHFGNNPAYASFAGQLGEALGKGGFHMIYGGGTVGLMGICANAAMAAGGKVTGVIPEVFIAKEQAHRGITELIEVENMTIRKQKMIAMGDAFVILPGGFGTLEELADTANQNHIYGDKDHQPPIIIVNIDGIYDALKQQMKAWREAGFIEAGDWGNIHFCQTLDEVMELLKSSEK